MDNRHGLQVLSWLPHSFTYPTKWWKINTVVNQIREAVRATHLSARFAKKSLKPRLGREKYKEYRELERRQKCGENCMVMRSTWLRNTISGSLSSTGIFHCSHQARPSRRRTGETSFRPEALPLSCTILTKNSLKVAVTLYCAEGTGIRPHGKRGKLQPKFQLLTESQESGENCMIMTSSHWRSICCSTLTRTNYQ